MQESSFNTRFSAEVVALAKWKENTYYEFDSENMRRQDAYFELANCIDFDITMNVHMDAEC